MALRVTAPLRLRKKPLYISINITNHCNLNCAYCSAYSPLSDEEYYKKEDLEKDLTRLKELYSLQNNSKLKTPAFSICGGEPLLHPDLCEIMHIVREKFQNTVIFIITNGILLNKLPDSFWEACANNKIAIQITKYPIKLPINDIREKARLYNVFLDYYVTKNEKHSKTFWKYVLDTEGKQNIKKQFSLCNVANRCPIMYKGKIGCIRVIYNDIINNYFNLNLEVTEKDYCDIYKIKSIDEIIDFIRTPIPYCRHCNWHKTVIGLEWHPSKKIISEWI
jgi:organic radical activating enzyme